MFYGIHLDPTDDMPTTSSPDIQIIHDTQVIKDVQPIQDDQSNTNLQEIPIPQLVLDSQPVTDMSTHTPTNTPNTSTIRPRIISVHEMSTHSKRRCKELIIELIGIVLEQHAFLRIIPLGIVQSISPDNISLYVHKVIQHEKISNLPDQYNDEMLIDFIDAFSSNIIAIPKSIHNQIHNVHSTLSHETKTIAWQYIKGIHMLYYRDTIHTTESELHSYDEDE